MRVYLTNAPAGGLTLLDLATVTGTAGGASLTLYEKQSVNGALGQTTPWSLFAAGDGAALTTSASGWATTPTPGVLRLRTPRAGNHRHQTGPRGAKRG